ncbi:MAG: hypothetical protein ACTHK1_08075 [Actinomycetales bacterium]
MNPSHRERGSVVLVVAAAGLLLIVALGAAGASLTAAARHRLQAVSDAAALAGATALGSGGDACAAARAVVAAARTGDVEACHSGLGSVDVGLVATLPGLPFAASGSALPQVRAQSRAGVTLPDWAEAARAPGG